MAEGHSGTGDLIHADGGDCSYVGYFLREVS